jgi:hypothetical protein
LQAAEQATGAKLEGDRRYGFHIYRWGQESPDPNDIHTTLVEVHEQALAYVSGGTVMIQRDGGSWSIDRSIPT